MQSAFEQKRLYLTCGEVVNEIILDLEILNHILVHAMMFIIIFSTSILIVNFFFIRFSLSALQHFFTFDVKNKISSFMTSVCKNDLILSSNSRTL